MRSFNALPEVEHQIHSMLARHRRVEAAAHPGGLRMSALGGPCVRKLWASCHDMEPQRVPEGRILAIFNHGEWVEKMVIELLQDTGYTLESTDESGEQFELIAYDGKLTGHMDGRIWMRILMQGPYVFECKSVKDERFDDLIEVGYQAWEPSYYGQIQGYMGWSGMKAAFVLCYAKNSSRIHTELIQFDPTYFGLLQSKAEIALGDEVPEVPAKATSQSCKFCRWCEYSEWCWGPLPKVRFAE